MDTQFNGGGGSLSGFMDNQFGGSQVSVLVSSADPAQDRAVARAKTGVWGRPRPPPTLHRKPHSSVCWGGRGSWHVAVGVPPAKLNPATTTLPDILVDQVGLHQMTDFIGHFGIMQIGHCGGEDRPMGEVVSRCSFNGLIAEDSFLDVPFYGHRPKQK